MGSTPSPHRVTLVHAAGCHLCESAGRVLSQVRAEIPFELEEVDITGEPELEARYREWLPVVEIDGERVFTYYVHAETFRRKLAQARGRAGTL